MIDTFLLLAAETHFVPPDHIAAKLAVPLGIVIFCGSVFLLLWSNYGAKKAAAIYSTALFGFCFVLGVFWWFGAPGTPVATGLQNFPGQAPDAYQGKWYAFEAGSPRAEFFPSANNFDDFQTIDEYAGTDDLTAPRRAFLSGDAEQGVGKMLAQWLPTDTEGGLRIGANRRQALQEAAGSPEPGETRADPFYVAEVEEVRLTDDGGVRLAAARIVTRAVFVDGETGQVTRTPVVEEGVWFAFKDPGALWFPSAVWTVIALVLFVLSLFWLDRLEQREKHRRMVVEEAEDLATPVAQ